PRGQRQDVEAGQDRPQADEARRGDHPVDDAAGAAAAGGPEWIAPGPHCPGFGTPRPGGQSPAEPGQGHAEADEADAGDGAGRPGWPHADDAPLPRTRLTEPRTRTRTRDAMPVRIRLRRIGRKKQPSYRIVVAEGHSPRGGGYVDNVGFYNPRRDPIELRIDLAKVDQWVSRGAQITPTVQSLIRKVRRGEGEVIGAAAPAAEVKAEAAPEARKPARKPAAKKAAAAEA